MTQKYTLHTHTIGFDGKNSVQDMVNRARELGFHTIGISNHFIVHENIRKSKMYGFAVQGGYANIYSSYFCDVMDKFIPHYNELDEIQQQNPDIKILRGMEVDFFNNLNWRNGFEKSIKILKPDYIIGSTHFIEYNNTLLNSHDWANADPKTQDVLLEKYWENLKTAAESGLFTWMAHLDLPKKVHLGSEDKWAEHELRAVDAIAKSNTMIEINTGLYKTDNYVPYPSDRILQMVAKHKIPVLISDDAHASNQIARHFDEAENLISKFNLTKYQR